MKTVALIAVLLAAPAYAQAPNEGIVLSLDKARREIVIRHGRLAEFDMPPMTMAFEVKDARMLDQVKPGDRVRFAVEILNGRFTVTRIAPRRAPDGPGGAPPSRK